MCTLNIVYIVIHVRSKINNWGGEGYIRISSTSLIYFENEKNSFVFTVCEHEDMNISPTIVDLAIAM